MIDSWLEIKKDSDFPVENIPFGIGRTHGLGPRIFTRVGDTLIDVSALSRLGYFDHLGKNEAIFEADSLNPFIGMGRPFTCKVRNCIQESFMKESPSRHDEPDFTLKI